MENLTKTIANIKQAQEIMLPGDLNGRKVTKNNDVVARYVEDLITGSSERLSENCQLHILIICKICTTEEIASTYCKMLIAKNITPKNEKKYKLDLLKDKMIEQLYQKRLD